MSTLGRQPSALPAGIQFQQDTAAESLDMESITVTAVFEDGTLDGITVEGPYAMKLVISVLPDLDTYRQRRREGLVTLPAPPFPSLISFYSGSG